MITKEVKLRLNQVNKVLGFGVSQSALMIMVQLIRLTKLWILTLICSAK
jgi:hypothetical protein